MPDKAVKTIREVWEKYPDAYFIMWCGDWYIEYGKLNADSPELDIEPIGDVRLSEDENGELTASFDVKDLLN